MCDRLTYLVCILICYKSCFVNLQQNFFLCSALISRITIWQYWKIIHQETLSEHFHMYTLVRANWDKKLWIMDFSRARIIAKGTRDGPVVKSTGCSPRGPGVWFPAPTLWTQQPPVSPVSEGLTLSSGPFGHCTNMLHKHPCGETTNTHKIKWKHLKYIQQSLDFHNSHFQLDLLEMI